MKTIIEPFKVKVVEQRPAQASQAAPAASGDTAPAAGTAAPAIGRSSMPSVAQLRPNRGEAAVATRSAGPAVSQKIGRNDPCWCGSGKKYKKCHGA